MVEHAYNELEPKEPVKPQVLKWARQKRRKDRSKFIWSASIFELFIFLLINFYF